MKRIVYIIGAMEHEPALNAVGERIKRERLKRGWSQGQLAQMIGKKQTASTIGRYENGVRRPKMDTLIDIAQAFGIPPEELVGAALDTATGKYEREVDNALLTIKPDFQELLTRLSPSDQSDMRTALEALMVFAHRKRLHVEVRQLVVRLEDELKDSFEEIKRQTLLPPKVHTLGRAPEQGPEPPDEVAQQVDTG